MHLGVRILAKRGVPGVVPSTKNRRKGRKRIQDVAHGNSAVIQYLSPSYFKFFFSVYDWPVYIPCSKQLEKDWFKHLGFKGFDTRKWNLHKNKILVLKRILPLIHRCQ